MFSQFAESFLFAVTLWHCFLEGPAFLEPPTASRSAQPEHLAALSDLYFQLFGGFRALPSTTDRKWRARRLSTQPETLVADNTTTASGLTTFKKHGGSDRQRLSCVYVCAFCVCVRSDHRCDVSLVCHLICISWRRRTCCDRTPGNTGRK